MPIEVAYGLPWLGQKRCEHFPSTSAVNIGIAAQYRRSTPTPIREFLTLPAHQVITKDSLRIYPAHRHTYKFLSAVRHSTCKKNKNNNYSIHCVSEKSSCGRREKFVDRLGRGVSTSPPPPVCLMRMAPHHHRCTPTPILGVLPLLAHQVTTEKDLKVFDPLRQ